MISGMAAFLAFTGANFFFGVDLTDSDLVTSGGDFVGSATGFKGSCLDLVISGGDFNTSLWIGGIDLRSSDFAGSGFSFPGKGLMDSIFVPVDWEEFLSSSSSKYLQNNLYKRIDRLILYFLSVAILFSAQ